MKTLIKHYIQELKDVQDGHLWAGQNYTKKLSQVTEEQLFLRPIEGMHAIAEILSHLTLWRTETILKIKTGEGSKTDECEENWLPLQKLKKKGWEKIKSDYDQSLSDIIELLEEREDSFLDELYFDTDFKDHYPYRFVINGMLHHDLYHLGQLGIIIKYLK